MADDLIHWIMVRSCDKFDRRENGMFNAACFSASWKEVTGLQKSLDGRAVEAILHGREDVVHLFGGAHYQMVLPTSTGKKTVADNTRTPARQSHN